MITEETQSPRTW